MEETNYFLCANLFPAKGVEPNIVKIKGHYFKGVFSSLILMKLDARKCIILSCLFIKIKDEVVFSCFSDLHFFFQNVWLATNSQNAVLNKFEDYCI